VSETCVRRARKGQSWKHVDTLAAEAQHIALGIGGGIKVELPLKGLGIGEQLAWYGKQVTA